MAKDLNISFLLDFYGDMLTQKQQDMIKFYYNDDLSLSEIAENEGITRQGVRDNIKRAEGQLLEMEARLGLADRFVKVKNGLEKIVELSVDINAFNMAHGFSREIDERARQISGIAAALKED